VMLDLHLGDPRLEPRSANNLPFSSEACAPISLTDLSKVWHWRLLRWVKR
jgi:hypothetical protein